MRLIAIVLGEENAKIRNSEAGNLLDYGFSNKKIQVLKNSEKPIEQIKLDKATKEKINIYSERDINILQDKNIANKKYAVSTKINEPQLPLKKGQVVGKVYVKEKGKTIYTGNLIVKEKVEKLKFMKLYLHHLKSIALGTI